MEENFIIDYILGGLSEEEVKAYTAKIAADPSLQKELIATENALKAIAEAKVSPNRSNAMPFELYLKMQQASSAKPTQTDASMVEETLPTNQNTRPSLKPHIRILTVAASLVLVAAVTFSIFLVDSISKKDAQIAEITTDKAQLESEFNQLVSAANSQTETLAVYSSNTTRVVPLKSKIENAEFLGNVYWDQETQKIFFDLKSLPNSPEGHSYQLWVLIDGKPYDAGMIDCHRSDLQLTKQIESYNVVNKNVAGFAVTLEKSGGSQVPSLDKMYLYGEI